MAGIKLNINAPKAITEFEAAAKEFELKEKLYRIIFRGKGLEFDKYRDYAPDEDASDIDWKASLRANKLIAKQYIEERELNILFVIDVGNNMTFGSSDKLKCEYAVEVFAALAHLIINSNDRVGVVLFNDKISQFIPPKGGNNHFFTLVDLLSKPEIYEGGSNFGNALRFLLDYVSKSIDAVFLISDFLKVRENVLDNLFLVAHKFETVGIMVKDLLDITLPNVNKEIVVEDPLSGQQILINPSKVKEIYEKNALVQANMIRRVFKLGLVDLLELTTDKPFGFSLAEFLGERAKFGRVSA